MSGTEAQPVSIMKTIDLANARQRLDEAAARHTTTVTYRSTGHCLIVGRRDRALALVDRLGDTGVTVVTVDPTAKAVSKALTDTGIAVFTVPSLSLDGHLGAYTAVANANQAEASSVDLGVSVQRPDGRFDRVLDLGQESLFNVRLPPFGYAHAPSDALVQDALESLDGFVGEFDKPRYFSYDASICAHSRSRLAGCSKCLDVCVTGAIASVGDRVAVDPYLCQGCGSCATRCPTGAMVYAYPKPSDAIARTRDTLLARPADTLLLHTEAHLDAVGSAELPDSVLTLAVEEVSAFGLDYWTTMLCAGVGRILLLVDGAEDDPNRHALEEQATLLRHLVEGLGVGSTVIQFISEASLATIDTLALSERALADLEPASFTTHNDKRATIRAALDTLAAALGGRSDDDVVALPSGSPFGHIVVDTDACTLCMACVSTCPSGALLDGQDTPALRLIEANCVQCGLCENACPESAITLEARYIRDSVEARRTRTLHAEAPFHCVVCHKAFATRRIIDTMLGKLSGHWMFGNDKALRRLKMCEDCRVKDIFASENGAIDVHSGAGDGQGGESKDNKSHTSSDTSSDTSSETSSETNSETNSDTSSETNSETNSDRHSDRHSDGDSGK